MRNNPYISPDGRWRWDGQRWVPNTASPSPAPQPRIPKRGLTTGEKWGIGCGSAIGLFFLLMLIVGLTGGGSSSSSTSSKATPAPTQVAAPAAPAPNPTAAAATPAPTPQYRPAEVHTGSGDDVVSTNWPAQVGIVTFECLACTRNVALKTDGRESLLVNEIGAYSGTQWINVRKGSKTTTFTITANAPWKLTIADLDAVPKGANAASGKGDSVVSLTDKVTKAAVTNQGERNFVVEVLSDGDVDLAVNEIGSYQGTVPLHGPALVQVKSSGSWSIQGSR